MQTEGGGVTDGLKLGKLPAEYDPRTARMADYSKLTVTGPDHAHWGHGLSYDMDGNDGAGDCVIAEYQHQDVIWCARSGEPGRTTPAMCIPTYSALTGYVPGKPKTDQGTSMLAANKYWKNTGMGGVKIDAFMSVDPMNLGEVKTAVYQFGGLSTGLAMPLSAQAQTFNGAWEVTGSTDNAPGSWGGHCVVICGFDDAYLYCVTWGRIQAMAWDFFTTYCDEAYVMLSADWMRKSGVSPSGFAWAKLQTYLSTL